MLVKLTLALLGGTILSLLFGYLVAYWRDIGRSSPKDLDESAWSSFFDTLTKLKKSGLKFSGRQKKEAPKQDKTNHNSQSHRRSRAPSSWEGHPELQRLLLKYEDFYPELYRYFENLKDNGEDLLKLEAKELEQALKLKVTPGMMGDRMHELLELRAFDSLGAQNQGPKAVRELWLCFCVAQIYLDDARFGSTTRSEELCRELSLDASSIFRGIEAQIMLIKGASKKALFKKYWTEHQKKPFKHSSYLQGLTPLERSQLCYKWARTKKHFGQIEEQLKETIKEMEKTFEELYREHNSEQKRQHGKKQHKKKSERQRSRPASADSNPQQWAYDLLEMRETRDFALIKKQFKKMAMKYHPDRLAREGLSEVECRRHHEHFVQVQRAYKALEKAYADKAA